LPGFAGRGFLCAVPLLTPLTEDQRTTFLVVALAPKVLRKLVGQLGTAPKGTRVDKLGEWELADTLVDYYQDDAEVAAAVDQSLRKELGPSPLAGAAAGSGAASALSDLVLKSHDPLRDLAWALMAHGGAEAGEHVATVVQTIIAEFDAADERAKAEAAAEATASPATASTPDAAARELEREAARAQAARGRALKRLGGLRDQLVDLEERLAVARSDARAERAGHDEARRERDRALAEVETLKARLAGGAAAEAARLAESLAHAERRIRGLESELEDAREAEATLAAQRRAATTERPAAMEPATSERGTASPASWSLPIYTDEFYDSIRRWDRKVVRTAFEKIHRLADDWRHPSLRAIPLEGLPGAYRIRIASDVRLIYRPLDGGRLEILSLIDREDLQRYIRTAKTRQGA
jgi:hypothetical protein